jgi:hypothetical protein
VKKFVAKLYVLIVLAALLAGIIYSFGLLTIAIVLGLVVAPWGLFLWAVDILAATDE